MVAISSDQPNTVVVEVVGVRRKVDLGLLRDNPPLVGDWVLIHGGFAMSKISEDDALDRVQTLRVLDEPSSAVQEVQAYSLEEDS